MFSPPIQIAAGLTAGSFVHGACTGDWLLATVATAAILALGATARLLRDLA